MITEREAMDLAEKVMVHMSVVEKYGLYAQTCPDPQVQQLVQRHQQSMQQHYNTLQGFLQQQQQGYQTQQNQW